MDSAIFKEVVDATQSGIIITDVTQDDHPIIYVNQGFVRLTGYEPGEVIGRNCRFMQKQDREQPELHIVRNAIRFGQHCQVTLRNYRKDGRMFWNEVTISPIKTAEGKVTHFVGIQSDVTDNRVTEESLRKEKQILVYANKILLENQRTIQNLEREVNKWRKKAGEKEIY